MKIICKTQDIIEAVNTVQKAIASKNTNPILDGILIECNDNVKFTGNSQELGIEYIIKASILEAGSIVVNSKLFGDIARKLPDGDVCIQIVKEKIIIDCLRSHFELTAISAEGYPSIPVFEKESVLKLKEKDLKEMLRGTTFAVGQDENRKNLMGALLENSDGSINMVSIDGFRMALRRKKYDGEIPEISVIIPGHALNELSKIIGTDDREVFIYSTRSLIAFEIGECKIVSRLIEGNFINYKTVIPDYHESKIKLKTKEFLLSMERASLMGMEEKKYPIKFSITEDKLILTSNVTIGNVREEVRVEVIGSAMDIGFNPKYYIDALKVIEDEEVEVYFTSAVGPATIKPLKSDNYAYMILPVQISDNSEQNTSNSGDEA